MQRNILCALLLVFLIFDTSFGQTKSLDSLYTVLESVSGKEKVNTFLVLNRNLKRSDPAKALQYANEALTIAKSLNDKYLIADALEHRAVSLLDFVKFDSAEMAVKEAESLLKELGDNSKEGSIQNLYGNLYVDQGDFDKGIYHYHKSLKAHELKNNKDGISTAYNNLGFALSRQGKYDSSNYYHYKSLDINRELNNYNSIAYSYYNLGVNFDMSGDFDQSLENFVAGLNIFDSLGNKRMVGSSYNSLGIIYTGQGLYDKALEYHKKNLKIKLEVENKRGIGFSYANIAAIYESLEQYDTAIFYHHKSLDIREEMGDKFSLAAAFHNLGRSYHRSGQFLKSKEFYEKAVPLMEEMGNKRGLTSTSLGFGSLALDMGSNETALKYAIQAEALAVEIGAKKLQAESYGLLASIHEKRKSYANANEYRKRYSMLNDSLYNAEKDEIIARITSQYETAKKDQEIAEQTLKMDQQEANINNQRLLIVILITGLIASLIIGLLVFNRYKLKQNNKALKKENESIKVERNLQLRKKADDIINYFATSLYGKNSVDEILWDVVNNCISQLDFEDCVIYLLDEERNVLVQKAAYGDKSKLDDQVLSPIDIPIGDGIVGYVAKTGVAEIIHDTTKDARYIVDDQSRLSEIAVPIMQQDRVIGVIDSEHAESNFYTEFHLQALTTIASICGSKIAQTQADLESEIAKIAKLEADQIKALDQLKSQFFANISHEFRTPLNLILGPLRKDRSELSEEDLKMMERNGWKLLNLVNQLLDLAKLEVGKLQLNESNIDINAHLKLSASHFSSMAQVRQIEYQVEVSEEVNAIKIDEDKLDKIIYNLLSNAIKFSSAGDTVIFKSSIKDQNLAIEVTDTGAGIDPQSVDRIFDRFYQADSSKTRRFEGTGIGLSLSKELTELMGGSITCSSEQGKGSSFFVTIPIVSVSPESIDQSDSIETYPGINDQYTDITTEPQSEPKDGLPIILVVEDNSDLRKYMTDHLSKNNNVISAANGKEGFSKAVSEVPDLIISDVMMPEMDGIELTNAVRSNDATSHIPTILLTARDDQETKNVGFQSGIDQYMSKPFDLDELETRVNGLIKQRDILKEKYASEIYLKPTDIEINDSEGAFIQKALLIVEENISDDQFSVEQFQKELGMSRMQLHRKLKALTNQSASEFIRTIRLERAAQLLANNQCNVAEAAYQVGFAHLSYFAKCFKEKYGVSPSSYTKSDL
ncbi:MAG: tetratricopeptide repeat protein [bacterium]|nr:tetratricopeptide repeat protein [bacterium]